MGTRKPHQIFLHSQTLLYLFIPLIPTSFSSHIPFPNPVFFVSSSYSVEISLPPFSSLRLFLPHPSLLILPSTSLSLFYSITHLPSSPFSQSSLFSLHLRLRLTSNLKKRKKQQYFQPVTEKQQQQQQ